MNLTFNFNSPDFNKETTGILNRDLIEWALKRVPTGYNIKPFVWNWEQDSLVIQFSQDYVVEYLNRDNHSTFITLGCLIESVNIAASAQGFELSYE